jgi:outer membrane protein TolC
MKRTFQFLGLIAATALVVAPAHADSADDAALAALRAQTQREPPVADVLRAALVYHRVHPEALDALRSNSHLRAFLPVLSGFGSWTDSGNASASAVSITNPTNTVANSAGQGYTLTLGGSWDFREVVFNPAEVQVYGLVGIEQDVSLEVTRTYFQRRALEIRLALRPPTDPLGRALMEMRVEEYGAVLDGLTGGFFTRAQTPPSP